MVQLRLSPGSRSRAPTAGAARTVLGVFTAALAGLHALPARSQESASQPVNIVATPSFVSQYMFRGIHISGPTLQPSVEADKGDMALGVWANVPLSGGPDSERAREVDPYASFKVALNQRWSFLSGVQVYTYPYGESQEGDYRATVEPYVGLNYGLSSWAFTPKIYYDVITQAVTGELNGAYSVPLAALNAQIDLEATLGAYHENRVVNPAANLPQLRATGAYWLAGLSIPVDLGRHAKLAVGYAYTSGFATSLAEGSYPRISNPVAMGRPVLTVSLSCTF